jgi:hypothetical protein
MGKILEKEGEKKESTGKKKKNTSGRHPKKSKQTTE